MSPVLAEIQNDLPGFSPNHVFEGAIKGENVDVMTGNVNVNIPLGPRYRLNDWFSYQVQLYYNSKIWEHECDPGPVECPGVLTGLDTYGQGFNIHFGRIYQHPEERAQVFRYQTLSPFPK